MEDAYQVQKYSNEKDEYYESSKGANNASLSSIQDSEHESNISKTSNFSIPTVNS